MGYIEIFEKHTQSHILSTWGGAIITSDRGPPCWDWGLASLLASVVAACNGRVAIVILYLLPNLLLGGQVKHSTPQQPLNVICCQQESLYSGCIYHLGVGRVGKGSEFDIASELLGWM